MLTGSQLLVRMDGKRIEPEYLLPHAGWALGACQRLVDWWISCANLPEKISRRELRDMAAPLLTGPGNPRIWEGFYHILQTRASFTESTEGLEEQLLNSICKHEQAKEEIEREKLAKQNLEFNKQRKMYMEQIL